MMRFSPSIAGQERGCLEEAGVSLGAVWDHLLPLFPKTGIGLADMGVSLYKPQRDITTLIRLLYFYWTVIQCTINHKTIFISARIRLIRENPRSIIFSTDKEYTDCGGIDGMMFRVNL